MHASTLISIIGTGFLAATAIAGSTGPATSDLILRYTGSLILAATMPVLATPINHNAVMRRQAKEEEEEDDDNEDNEDEDEDQNDEDDEDEENDDDDDDDNQEEEEPVVATPVPVVPTLAKGRNATASASNRTAVSKPINSGGSIISKPTNGSALFTSGKPSIALPTFVVGQPKVNAPKPVITPSPVAAGVVVVDNPQSNTDGGFVAFQPADGAAGFTTGKPALTLPPVTLGTPV